MQIYILTKICAVRNFNCCFGVAWAKETSNVGFRELMVGKEGDFKHSILLSPLKLQIYVTRNGVDWMKSNYVETCNPSS